MMEMLHRKKNTETLGEKEQGTHITKEQKAAELLPRKRGLPI